MVRETIKVPSGLGLSFAVLQLHMELAALCGTSDIDIVEIGDGDQTWEKFKEDAEAIKRKYSKDTGN